MPDPGFPQVSRPRGAGPLAGDATSFMGGTTLLRGQGAIVEPKPHQVRVESVFVAGANPRDRGMKRAAQIAPKIRATVKSYEEYFTSLGISERDQKQAARNSMQALREWNPDLYEEISGIALAAGMQVNQLGLTIARTEILTLATEPASECSTLAYQRPGTTVSAQNWDWTLRFTGNWHTHHVAPLANHTFAQVPGAAGGELAHAGFVEYGMPGKIGMNQAGLGVHLNLLRHEQDAPGGVPIHAVLATVLARTSTVEQAIAVIKGAETSASSMITLVSADRVVRAEISPQAVNLVEGPGFHCHTNHFKTLSPAQGALKLRSTSDTYERLATLESQAKQLPENGPATAADLLPALRVEITNPPLPDPLDAGATLVTVQFDPAVRTVTISPGGPEFAALRSYVFKLPPENGTT